MGIRSLLLLSPTVCQWVYAIEYLFLSVAGVSGVSQHTQQTFLETAFGDKKPHALWFSLR